MSKGGPLADLQAWLFTGPPARGLAFAIDFTAALGKGAVAVLKGLTRR